MQVSRLCKMKKLPEGKAQNTDLLQEHWDKETNKKEKHQKKQPCPVTLEL